MIDFDLLKNILVKNNSFLITTHVNPDADAIGSEIALYFILKELGKEIYIINHSVTPYNLTFLDFDKKIEKYDESRHDAIFNNVDVLVGIDFNRSDRIVSMRQKFNDSLKLKIAIDHHLDLEDFVNYFFLDNSYSATGHIIYDLIKKTNIVNLNYPIAYNIYAAIMTDTGSFRFEKTTPEVHLIAADLLKLGVVPGEVFDKVYDQSLFSKIKLLGLALNTIQLHGEKQEIGYMILTQKMFETTGAIESDTDGFVNFSLSVKDVRMGILFLELKQGFKVSFRSKGNIPVNKLAAEFGGGGHFNAAGLRITAGKMAEFIPKILNRAEEFLAVYI
ncbi:MAG TPA: bifunctional oligoribonuclease/PAP phosphatase NrnA [Ignavibacteriaceae bacterium]|nr:bifunctional oligoribonuclease/PAP phosphatase NrnA [Ignavibacteriaceae bacterium]